MLRAADISVAPQNAEAGIKTIAAYITTDRAASPLLHAVSQLFPALLRGDG
jgi:hydroxymethylpyrimidine pyrophosphatase-like HAD family hydrolase